VRAGFWPRWRRSWRRRARRAQYSALASPALAVSLDGFAGGRGGGWRAAHGLVGARSFAEQELRAVAAQVQAAF